MNGLRNVNQTRWGRQRRKRRGSGRRIFSKGGCEREASCPVPELLKCDCAGSLPGHRLNADSGSDGLPPEQALSRKTCTPCNQGAQRDLLKCERTFFSRRAVSNPQPPSLGHHTKPDLDPEASPPPPPLAPPQFPDLQHRALKHPVPCSLLRTSVTRDNN